MGHVGLLILDNIQGYMYQTSKGGFEILDLFWTNFGPFEKIVDFSVCRRVQRSRNRN